jgi:hypothetical protein
MTRTASVVSAALLCAGMLAAAATGPASAKKAKGKLTNPLAGRYTGTTEDGGTVSFRITRAGAVRNFTAGPATLICTHPPVLSPEGVQVEFPPPTVLTTAATVSAAGPIRLAKPVAGYPKGKRFDYSGPGGNPQGIASITGKVAKGFRGMEGFYFLKRVPSGNATCAMDAASTGGAGLVSWEARRLGKR